jgi:hypothetical protein
MLVTMVAVLVRGPDKSNVMSVTSVRSMTTSRTLLQRMDTSDVPWAQVVGAVFDNLNCRYCQPPCTVGTKLFFYLVNRKLARNSP